MLRMSAKTSALRREASPVAEDASNSPRCYARARRRNNREIGHFRTAYISQATLRQTETTDLTLAGQF